MERTFIYFVFIMITMFVLAAGPALSDSPPIIDEEMRDMKYKTATFALG